MRSHPSLRPLGRRLRELPEILASLPRLSPEELAAFESVLEEVRRVLQRSYPAIMGIMTDASTL